MAKSEALIRNGSEDVFRLPDHMAEGDPDSKIHIEVDGNPKVAFAPSLVDR
jgi:hypothetical protein